MPFTSQLAREFTVFDRWHASVLGPTYPDRAYLHSGQSGTYKTNMLPFATGGYDWETIWDRLARAGVPAAYYYTDLPVPALWGGRLDTSRTRSPTTSSRRKRANSPGSSSSIPRFSATTAPTTIPVPISAPAAVPPRRVATFARSKHWKRGAFVVMYDEWGGFYDTSDRPCFRTTDPIPWTTRTSARRGSASRARCVAVRTARLRRSRAVRPHIRAAVPRVAIPRCAGDGGASRARPGSSDRDRRANNLGAGLASEPVERRVGIHLDVALTDRRRRACRQRPAVPARQSVSRSPRRRRITPSSRRTKPAGSSGSASRSSPARWRSAGLTADRQATRKPCSTSTARSRLCRRSTSPSLSGHPTRRRPPGTPAAAQVDANRHRFLWQKQAPPEREPEDDAVVDDLEAPRQEARHDKTAEREHERVERRPRPVPPARRTRTPASPVATSAARRSARRSAPRPQPTLPNAARSAKWPAGSVARLPPTCGRTVALPTDRRVGRRSAREHLVLRRVRTDEHELVDDEVVVGEDTHLGQVQAHLLDLGRRAGCRPS